MSIKPHYVKQIFQGTKQYEYRKRAFDPIVKRVYVYATYPIQRVIGYMIIDKTIIEDPIKLWQQTYRKSGMDAESFFSYYQHKSRAVAFHIKEVHQFKKPQLIKEYSNFIPQSFAYIS